MSDPMLNLEADGADFQAFFRFEGRQTPRDQRVGSLGMP